MSRIAFIKQNESKANCLIISPFKDYDTNLYNRLNGNRKNKINLVENADYLGCTLTAEDISFTNVKLRIEIAKQKLDSLLYNGFVGTRIMPTETQMTQIRMYVDTSALTSLDAFYIDSRSELLLKNFGKSVIKSAYGLTKSGSAEALLLLSGRVHLHVQLRANLVGLTLRILAKDCRVRVGKRTT